MADDDPSPPPIDPRERARVGLCVECSHVKKVVSGRGSTFYMCTEPTLPKYPNLPVRGCPRFGSV